jgi:hypothetical protein
MTLLLWNKLRLRCCGALQKRIGQKTELKQVLQRADELIIMFPRRRGSGEICPVCRKQRLASVRQNQNEEQTFLPDGVPEYFQRLSFKRMMAASDRYTLRIVPEVGSLRRFPLTQFHMPN